MAKSTQLVTYNVSTVEIASTKGRYAALSADTPAGYEEVRQAIAHVRDTRVAIEKRRVELKADFLEGGRKVDSIAKELTALLLEIEEPLKAKKKAVDDEKERIRAEAAVEKQRALEAEIAAKRAIQEAQERAEREAEAQRMAEERAALEAERQRLAAVQAELEARQREELARVEAARQAERERIDAERKAEQDRVDAEREKLAAERRAEEERARAERKALDAERKRLADEKAAAEKIERDRIEAAERAEFERRAKIVAEQEAREKLDRDRVEAVRVAMELAAMRPDVEKVTAFAAQLRAIEPPEVQSGEVRLLLAMATASLKSLADDLDRGLEPYSATPETQEEAA